MDKHTDERTYIQMNGQTYGVNGQSYRLMDRHTEWKGR
jgi:hypothetical protein